MRKDEKNSNLIRPEYPPQDVSELVKVYQEREAAKQQEMFFSAVSHELRTPLNGIIGLSDSLIHNPACTEQMTKSLTVIKLSGVHLAKLIEDILDQASARQASCIIKCEALVLQDVAECVSEQMQPMVPKNVSFHNRLAEQPLLHLEGDSVRLKQVSSCGCCG